MVHKIFCDSCEKEIEEGGFKITINEPSKRRAHLGVFWPPRYSAHWCDDCAETLGLLQLKGLRKIYRKKKAE